MATIDEDIAYLRTLSGEALVEEIMKRKWFVHPDDLIGGFCAMPVNAPPSSECFEIGNFISKSFAEHIVELHNVWLTKATPLRHRPDLWKAPWDENQISALIKWQNGAGHPYTCGMDSSHSKLVPSRNGWHCVDCGYTQDWAHVHQNLLPEIMFFDEDEDPVSRTFDGRDRDCVERWPGCFSGGYDPRCCRFPKSCSC